MQIKIFTVPILGGEALNEELNKFLRSHKVLKVDQQLDTSLDMGHWTFCVQYIEANTKTSNQGRGSIDYKEVLSEEAFTRFSKLRVIRKQIAQQDGVPAFAVFSNVELAELAKMTSLSPAKMKKVKGIGEKKIEKYAERFLQALADEKSK